MTTRIVFCHMQILFYEAVLLSLGHALSSELTTVSKPGPYLLDGYYSI